MARRSGQKPSARMLEALYRGLEAREQGLEARSEGWRLGSEGGVDAGRMVGGNRVGCTVRGYNMRMVGSARVGCATPG